MKALLIIIPSLAAALTCRQSIAFDTDASTRDMAIEGTTLLYWALFFFLVVIHVAGGLRTFHSLGGLECWDVVVCPLKLWRA